MIWSSSSRSGNFVVETQASGRLWKVSRSTFPTIDSPVRMIRCSSSKAAAACGSLKTSKSVLPTRSSIDHSGVWATRYPRLTVRKRLSRSLK